MDFMAFRLNESIRGIRDGTSDDFTGFVEVIFKLFCVTRKEYPKVYRPRQQITLIYRADNKCFIHHQLICLHIHN